MSIEFLCPTCQQQLRVPDTAAGKNAKCPKCASILVVPGARQEVSPLSPPPQAGFNFAPPLPSAVPPKAPPFAPSSNFVPPAKQHGGGFVAPASGNPFAFDGGQFPTTQATLPMTQGTMPPPQIQPAGYVGGLNPYAAPQTAYLPNSSPNVRVELTPIVNHSIKVWQDNLSVLLATTLMPVLFILLLFGMVLAISTLAAVIEQPALVGVAVALLYFGLFASQFYFGVGQMHVCMLVARGQPATVGDMFVGMDKFLPLLGYSLLITPILLIAALPLYVPMFILLFIYWPSYFLVVDRKCGVMESFNAAARITEGNKMTTFLVHLVGGGFVTLGYFACLVGVFAAMPLVSLMWCTAYLMMSGQIPVPPRRQPPGYVPPGYGPPGHGQPNYGPPGYGPKQGLPPAGFLPPAGK